MLESLSSRKEIMVREKLSTRRTKSMHGFLKNETMQYCFGTCDVFFLSK